MIIVLALSMITIGSSRVSAQTPTPVWDWQVSFDDYVFIPQYGSVVFTYNSMPYAVRFNMNLSGSQVTSIEVYDCVNPAYLFRDTFVMGGASWWQYISESTIGQCRRFKMYEAGAQTYHIQGEYYNQLNVGATATPISNDDRTATAYIKTQVASEWTATPNATATFYPTYTPLPPLPTYPPLPTSGSGGGGGGDVNATIVWPTPIPSATLPPAQQTAQVAADPANEPVIDPVETDKLTPSEDLLENITGEDNNGVAEIITSDWNIGCIGIDSWGIEAGVCITYTYVESISIIDIGIPIGGLFTTMLVFVALYIVRRR